MKNVIFASIITISFFGCDVLSRDTVVTGVVVDKATQQPLGGIWIGVVHSQAFSLATVAVETRTSADGRFRLRCDKSICQYNSPNLWVNYSNGFVGHAEFPYVGISAYPVPVNRRSTHRIEMVPQAP